eukprot:7378834-Prymnesium_polylepis.1
MRGVVCVRGVGDARPALMRDQHCSRFFRREAAAWGSSAAIRAQCAPRASSPCAVAVRLAEVLEEVVHGEGFPAADGASHYRQMEQLGEPVGVGVAVALVVRVVPALS